jgi:arginyl-tRNA synthetase
MNVLNQVKATVKAAIVDAVVAAGLVEATEVPEITLEVPKDKVHGDFATNIAMQLTRIAKQNPRQIAEKVIEHLHKEQAFIAEAEIAGPGFINLKMDKSYLYPIIGEVVALGDRYGEVNIGQGQKVQVEFVSANPTGSLHLGHARGAAVGDALCNVFDLAGY